MATGHARQIGGQFVVRGVFLKCGQQSDERAIRIGEIGLEDLCGAPQVSRSSGSILGTLGTLDQQAGQVLPALLAHVAVLEPMEIVGPTCVLWHFIIERVAAHVASLRNATKRNPSDSGERLFAPVGKVKHCSWNWALRLPNRVTIPCYLIPRFLRILPAGSSKSGTKPRPVMSSYSAI